MILLNIPVYTYPSNKNPLRRRFALYVSRGEAHMWKHLLENFRIVIDFYSSPSSVARVAMDQLNPRSVAQGTLPGPFCVAVDFFPHIWPLRYTGLL